MSNTKPEGITALTSILNDRNTESSSDEFVIVSLTVDEWRVIRDYTESMQDILECDFDTIAEAGVRLREISQRDFPELPEDRLPVRKGGDHYVIKAVIESLFSDKDRT